MDALNDVHMVKITSKRSFSGPLQGILAGLPTSQKILKIWPNGAVAVVARMGAAQEDFLELQPGTVLLLVEKVFRGVSKTMHASLPVHGERLHDSNNPRLLAQPLGGNHVTWVGRQRWMLAPSDASRNRTLPGWQRWMKPKRRKMRVYVPVVPLAKTRNNSLHPKISGVCPVSSCTRVLWRSR